jgi:hypothetical protein
LDDSGSGVSNYTMLQEVAWETYLEYKAREMAKCGTHSAEWSPAGENYPICVQFNDDTGKILPTPTQAPVTTVTATTATVPTPETCSNKGDGSTAMGSITSASKLLPAGLKLGDMQTQIGKTCDSEWKQCYSAATDGWASSTMHAACDNKGPTLSVVKTADRVFGAFVPVSTEGSEHVLASASFLIWRQRCLV